MPTAAGLYYFAHEEDNLRRPPLILIHGSGGTHLHWPAEARRISGQRIFAVDLPGHGKSEGIGCQSALEYARAISAFMDKLKLGPAVIAGHSLGGAIALTLALRFPKRVLGLGLVGTGARLRVAPAILDNAASPATFPAAVQAAIEWSYGPEADPRLKELGAQRMLETRPPVLHGDFLACNEFDVMDKIGKIDVPALILCGSQDRLTPVKYSKYLHDQLPKSRLQVVEGAGHMVTLERPGVVAAALGSLMGEFADQPVPAR